MKSPSAKRGAADLKLQPHTRLDSGNIIRTGASGTADLVLGYNRTLLRLTPGSALRVVKLGQMLAGDEPMSPVHGNNGVDNGQDPQPPGNKGGNR